MLSGWPGMVSSSKAHPLSSPTRLGIQCFLSFSLLFSFSVIPEINKGESMLFFSLILKERNTSWIPAFAGMTRVDSVSSTEWQEWIPHQVRNDRESVRNDREVCAEWQPKFYNYENLLYLKLKKLFVELLKNYLYFLKSLILNDYLIKIILNKA